MLIENNFIRLEYDPTKDILYFQWPDFYEYAVPELRYILKNVTDTIKSYDIKYLIIDARSSVIALSDTEYADVTTEFSKDIASTRLIKSARIIGDVTAREQQVQAIRAKAGMTLETRSFHLPEEAVAWFQSDKA
ncbi:hypothetical protein [Pontibacter akesuensis]|uniref:SpoIIAA-like n=1 Tax=Pontibacter akesuensis TaxID=388950 RepID=A0A1I7I5H2_9BACT|nr:hypothetical protein [Pontibacter akesuensis]GHA65315.1 hypothetical protein GCM10007389_17660 [Pontibacter akesuensis]SFU68164.1 hypothetical protein SAMN04487941_1929 [Pontibacter akesuensis]